MCAPTTIERSNNESQFLARKSDTKEVTWWVPPRSLARALFWVPKAVHYSVLITPFLIIFSLKYFFGLHASVLCCAGAAIHLYASILSPVYFTPRVTKDDTTKNKKTKDSKKRIAVIGAGPSGLATAKELLEHGHTVQCFDRTAKVGGIFANKFWHAGQLTSSPYVTCFSDFEPERDPKTGGMKCRHWFKEEYCSYLEKYAKHFGVTPHLFLEKKVIKVTQLLGSGMRKPVFYLEIENLKTGVTEEVGPFDHVAVCSGNFDGKKFIPCIHGLDKFVGKVIHSADFKDMSTFKSVQGKRIVTVGLGESMADLIGAMCDLPTPPSACSVSVRNGAFSIPRVNPLTNKNNDYDTTRLRYALPKAIHNASIVVCSYLSALFSWEPLSSSSSARFEMFRRIPGAAPAYRPASKSGAWVPHAASGKVALKPGVTRIVGRDVHFADGTIMEDVDVVAFGTGFEKRDFPFFTDTSFGPGRDKRASDPTELFLRIFDPHHGSSLAFIGIGIRPLVGSIPTIAEMQARLFAKVVSEELELPSTEKMVQLACKQAAADKKASAKYNDVWKGTVNWIPYMDSLAKEVGCLPRLSWMVSQPRLALKLLIGPMTAFQYRLTGPRAKRAQAEDVIHHLPIGSRSVDVMFYAALHTAVALLSWPSSLARLVSPGLLSTPLKAHRPTLVEDPHAEKKLRTDPEAALSQYKALYGKAIRFKSAGGKTTVALLEQDLANKALEAKELSFDEASYQSKVRFGLKAVVKDRAGVAKLSKFFHSFMNGRKVVSEFETSMVGALKRRLVEVVVEECKGRDGVVIISLQSLVGRVVFAANVESIFGEDVYTPLFYEDFLLFCSSIGYRSASGASQGQTNVERKDMEGAKSRLLKTLRTARKSSSASLLIQKIRSQLNTDERHADLVALMLLWGSNVNLLPTSVWLVADLLKDDLSSAALRRERAQVVDANGSDKFVDLTHQRRPLLSAVVAEGLRLRTRPNMYRVAVADCTLKTKEEEVQIRAGEWIHMFPRLYLHHNPDFYPQPSTFHPFERFGCPFQHNKAACPFRQTRAESPNAAQHHSSPTGVGLSESTNSVPLQQNITQAAYRNMFGIFSSEQDSQKEMFMSTPSTGIVMDNSSSTESYSSDNCSSDNSNGGTGCERKASERSSIVCRLLRPTEGKDETATNPFLAGNQHLRAFGGGKAPCPGKDYAVTMLKAFVDLMLLSPDCLVDVSLADDEAPLPPAVTETVASTPAPSKDIMIKLERVAFEMKSV